MGLNRTMTLKAQGEDVKNLQIKLKEHGFFSDRIDGYFGQNTLVAVTNFQRAIGIKADGIVGSLTWNQIINFRKKTELNESKPEIKLPVSFNDNGLLIYDFLIPDGEYLKEETDKNTIWLHHTEGGSRPDWTINGWTEDKVIDKFGKTKSVRVATAFVIGRKSSSSEDVLWDGKILRTFDDKYWAYHLGISSKNSIELNSLSVAIEICNYGALTLGKDGRFYNWVKKPVKESDVVKLDKPFRGQEYFEKYTEAQLENLRKLIKHLSTKWGITIETGIYNEDWFNFDQKWFSTGGLRSHTQVRKDKLDIFPQKEMIQMLSSL